MFRARHSPRAARQRCCQRSRSRAAIAFMLSALLLSMPALTGNVSVLSSNPEATAVEATPTPAATAKRHTVPDAANSKSARVTRPYTPGRLEQQRDRRKLGTGREQQPRRCRTNSAESAGESNSSFEKSAQVA